MALHTAELNDGIHHVASIYLNVPPGAVYGNINTKRAINHCHPEESKGEKVSLGSVRLIKGRALPLASLTPGLL